MLDGEARRLQTPLRIRTRARALRVLAPVKADQKEENATDPRETDVAQDNVGVTRAGIP